MAMYVKTTIKQMVDNMDGEPLNDEQYQKHIAQILLEVRAGEVISHEEIKKESGTW